MVHRFAKLSAIAAVAALLAACSGGPQSSIPTTQYLPAGQMHTMVDDGVLIHYLPTFSGIQAQPTDPLGRLPMARPAASSGGNLLYGGGPVQTAPKIYVVFWGSGWNTSSGDPDGVQALLKNWYATMGGSKWLNSVTQYTQSNGSHVGNSGNIFAGSYVDTSSVPTHPGNSAVQSEAAKAIAHFGDYSASASYVVAIEHGHDPTAFARQWCAWHSSQTVNGSKVAYTDLPYMPDGGSSCGAGSVNKPGTNDGVTIVSGHEQGETETDPQPSTGWVDSSGAENGDKCAWIGLENNPNAGGYPTQPLWSNATSSCVQSY